MENEKKSGNSKRFQHQRHLGELPTAQTVATENPRPGQTRPRDGPPIHSIPVNSGQFRSILIDSGHFQRHQSSQFSLSAELVWFKLE